MRSFPVTVGLIVLLDSLPPLYVKDLVFTAVCDLISVRQNLPRSIPRRTLKEIASDKEVQPI
jgi:hypothetical protein